MPLGAGPRRRPQAGTRAAPPRVALTCRPASPGRPRWLGVGRSHAPPRAVTVIASPERVPGAQARNRARRREPAGRERAGELGELCGATACGARRAGAGRGARLRRALRNAPRSPGTLRAAGERSCPHLDGGCVCAASERAPQGAARVSPVTPGLEAKAEAGARLYRQVRASSRPFLCGASVRPAGAAVSAAWSLTLLLNH